MGGALRLRLTHPTASSLILHPSKMFHLRIHQEEQVCFFDLSWGRAQRLSKTLKLPDGLMSLYRDWQHAYLSFYNTKESPDLFSSDSSMRGKVAAAGAIATPHVDWHARLVETQTRLLFEFHRWLQQTELFDFYTTIAEVSRTHPDPNADIDIFLTCTPIELARLPWESWELGATFATNRKIRMTRLPLNIRAEVPDLAARNRQRPRILVILGSDQNQDFSKDWQQLQRSLGSLVEIPEPIGWRPGKSIHQLKNEIVQALVDPQGWDILFFAGHSNETQLTGGDIGIAPGVSIQASEIASQLAIARERGLQFALFNSCSGLSLAGFLIDLGLSQVAVMREPIENHVAQEFLVQFLQGLSEYKDVHESLVSACQFLETEKNLTYPSAYLVPSLFRYPETKLFRLDPPARWNWVKQFAPSRYEAIALSTLLLLSILLPTQDWLLNRRLWTQAIYREITQRTIVNSVPPVLLVQIDNESIVKAGISDPAPIPYDYLGNLVDRVAAYRPKVIGIDYILDRPRNSDQTEILSRAIQTANTQGIEFVLGATHNQGVWEIALPELINNNKLGDIGARTYYMDLPFSEDEIDSLSYTLARTYQTNWQTGRTRRSLITLLSYAFGQRWLDPIVDFSLPPDQIYQSVPAWKLLQQANLPEMQNVSQQVILIAPGGYADSEALEDKSDSFTPPLAVRHWYLQEDSRNAYRAMTGAEFHAYKLHHLLRQRLVIPIPNLWMILIAAIASKRFVALIQKRSPRRSVLLLTLTGGSLIYSLVSLELYLTSIAILLPIALPTLTVWLFILPYLKSQKHL
jgi:hypothetical protein